MKHILFYSFLIFFGSHSLAQECYIESTDSLITNDFSKLWPGVSYQGTIGDSNQRIEIRFLNILKDKDGTYKVIGKSKVNSNICDFEGTIKLTQIYKLDTENLMCEGPDYSSGYVIGEYVLKEDPKQNHVGTFNGKMKTHYQTSYSGIKPYNGWTSNSQMNEFIGTWTEYSKDAPKYCSWGYLIPPTKNNDLFRHYDNEFYLFNPKFLNKGWKDYIVAHLNSFTIIPKDFSVKGGLKAEQIDESYSKEDIETARQIESQEWWK